MADDPREVLLKVSAHDIATDYAVGKFDRKEAVDRMTRLDNRLGVDGDRAVQAGLNEAMKRHEQPERPLPPEQAAKRDELEPKLLAAVGIDPGPNRGPEIER